MTLNNNLNNRKKEKVTPATLNKNQTENLQMTKKKPTLTY